VSDVTISRCAGCGWQGTPLRLWCPGCGGDGVEEVAVTGGVVAETTTVRRFAGGALAPVEVASIAVDGGGTLIARLTGGPPGVRARLSDDSGAPVAAPSDGEGT
jgi:uncharacterized OB-fold protein